MSWRNQAACIGFDPKDFFPERGDTWTEETRRAMHACKKCPVRAECLTHALNEPESFGIWGGMGYRSRMKIARKVSIPINVEETKRIIREYDKAIQN